MAFYMKTIAVNPSRFCSLCVTLLPQIKASPLRGRSPSWLTCAPGHLHGYKSFSSSLTYFEPRHGPRDAGSSLTPQEENRGTKSVVRIFRNDEPIVLQISHFENSHPMDLLNFIETVEPQQLDHRAIEVIARILSVTVGNETVQSKKNILKSVGMQKYCHCIRKTCRGMDSRLLVTLVKLFGQLGAPGTHPTFQMTLRLLSKQVSTMELAQIVFLNYILESLRPESTSTLSEAVKLALPVIFQSQVDLQLRDTSPKTLVNCLAFSLITRCKDSTVSRIANMLLELPPGEIGVQQAVDIQKFLTENWRNLPETVSLLERVYPILAANVHSLDDATLTTVIGRCASRVLRGHMCFYNEDFVGACCNLFVETRNEFQVLRALAPMSLLRHVNIEFLERCADIAASDPQRILNDDTLFFTLIRAFSGACYKPEKWNILQPMLLEHPATTKDISSQDIPLIVDYLVLDTLPLNLLEKVFSPDYFPRLDAWLQKSGPYTLTIICNAIKQLYPEYSGPLPPASMVESWKHAMINRIKNFRHSLQAALEAGFGGESYVLSGIVHEGLHIDHCIVMRKGGYPIAVQNRDVSDLNEIERPENSSCVLVKVFGAEAYATNTRRLRGIHHIESRIIKSFGHPVVEVDVVQWRELADPEKIPYLVQKVRENVEKVQI